MGRTQTAQSVAIETQRIVDAIIEQVRPEVDIALQDAIVYGVGYLRGGRRVTYSQVRGFELYESDGSLAPTKQDDAS